ncbi:MAG: hypothetical protein ACXVDI_24475 [Ktedonobacterales bacterium]
MSHRVAKQLRKSLRAGGNDPRQINVHLGKSHFIPALGGPGALFKGKRTLQANCGRALYRNLKKLRAHAFD